MGKIIIDQERCKGCLLCISFCPKGLIAVEEKLNCKGIKPVKFSPFISGIPPEAGKEISECVGCLQCALICPDCCIEVYK